MNVRTWLVPVVVATGLAALVSVWGVAVTFPADDATKPFVQTAFAVCGIACFILAALIWRRTPPTPN